MSFASLELLAADVVFYLTAMAPYAAAGALLLVLIALLAIAFLRGRLSRLMTGRNGNIEETIGILSREVKELRAFRSELEQYLKEAEARLHTTLRGVGVVRFNPFTGEGAGGNQSFAVALLDERGDGVVFSTLNARERVGVYAKPIMGGTSSFELTNEEREAIEKAKQSMVRHKQ